MVGHILRKAVRSYGLPSWWTGYRILPVEPLEDHCHRMSQGGTALPVACETVEPGGVACVPLPCNIADREDLPRNAGQWGFAFYDVPDRRLKPMIRATLRECWVAAVADQWGDESYAIVSRDMHSIPVRGTCYLPTHAPLIRRREAAPRIDSAWWILEQWNCNYSHWVQWHLPKIAWIHERGGSERILMPKPNRISGVVQASVRMLGLPPETGPVFQYDIVRVGELHVLDMDDYCPSALQRVRDRVKERMRPCRSGRRIFISRRKALWRHIANEEDCWRILEHRGFERVCLEDLSFEEQTAMMAETGVLISVHGSGLVNMLFAPAGCHVVEAYDPAFPNPQFYALAGALEHHYWLLECVAVGSPRPGYTDLSIPPAALCGVLDRIEGFPPGLRQRP